MKTDELGRPMIGDGCRAEPFSEAHREALKTACAEDPDIWPIYASDFGPDGFEDSIAGKAVIVSVIDACGYDAPL